MTTKITSSGVIRNAESPRVGVVSANSLQSWFFDELYNGSAIDLTYQLWREDKETEIRAELVEQGMDSDTQEFENELESRMQNETDHFEPSGSTWLVGAWFRNSYTGKYEIDTSGKLGDFALTYNSDSNNACVEWSTLTTPCNHTSPCYVMADGSGPCGDLNTPGDSVIAYTLPAEFFRGEND